MITADLPFREVWAVDFEFTAPPGERPKPICLVARELKSGRTIRLWEGEFDSTPPYHTGPDMLFVAYYSSAEFGCHLALNWPMPERVLDLFTEFRRATNGVPSGYANSLLGVMAYHGLDGLGTDDKAEMRELAMRGGPWTPTERASLLDYCESDVVALAKLLPAMLPRIDLPRALLRGRYMAAAARMEWNGVPIDTETLSRLRAHWTGIQDRLIAEIDADYGVFEGRTFKRDRFSTWLAQAGIPWPRLKSESLDLSDEAFKEAARAHPRVAPLRELRNSLAVMRLNELAAGRDGRNRCLLSAFRARTSRNQPSNTQFIFGPSVWLRGLIKPPPGHGLAYVDWSQQEFGIAAALSGDTAMMEAYRSGDPYLAFATQAGAAPADATKHTHRDVRELFKACILATQYGMEADSLASRIGKPVAAARQLLRLHRQTFKKFWQWSDAAVDAAMTTGRLRTVFGWDLRVGASVNPRSLRNHPMQANGAEMLRLACCIATERGVPVCAPVHDAVLICAPIARLDLDVMRMRWAMHRASRIVLNGFGLSTDVKVVRYPDRYADPRGAVMWQRVMALLDEAGRTDKAA